MKRTRPRRSRTRSTSRGQLRPSPRRRAADVTQVRQCAQCSGIVPEARPKNALYCSYPCKSLAASRRRKRLAGAVSRHTFSTHCLTCGHELNERRGGKQYCDTTCQGKASWQRNKSGERERSLRIRYGLSLNQFDSLLAAQGAACAVCHTTEPGPRGWCVDHDHACCHESARSCGDCVRGILCGPCNTGLGHFGDDADRLMQAVAYLLSTRDVLNDIETGLSV